MRHAVKQAYPVLMHILYDAYRVLLVSLCDICFRDTDQCIGFGPRNTILLAGRV